MHHTMHHTMYHTMYHGALKPKIHPASWCLHTGASGYALYACYPLIQGAAVGWVAGGLAVLSGASAVFCLYNVLAGGNPPPSKKKA